MTREQEILDAITYFAPNVKPTLISPQKLAAYLARMEEQKDNEIVYLEGFGWMHKDTLERVKEYKARMEGSKSEEKVNILYSDGQVREHARSEIHLEGCCGEWTGGDAYDCDRDSARTLPGQCKCNCHPKTTHFMAYQATPPSEEKKCVRDDVIYTSLPPQHRCKNCGKFWFTHEMVPNCSSPTPPDAWEEEWLRLWADFTNHVRTSEEVLNFIRSKKKEWENREAEQAKKFFELALAAMHSTTLDEVEKLIEQDRVELRDPSDHLPNAYQYLKGKNDLRDWLLTRLKEMRTK